MMRNREDGQFHYPPLFSLLASWAIALGILALVNWIW